MSMKYAKLDCVVKKTYGGIAQLGERLNGIQEVSGSIPLISTISWEVKMGLLQKTNLRQALIYIHFHTEDRILAQIVENFSHFGHAYAGSTVLVGPES